MLKFLVAAVLLAGCARLAGAQPLVDSAPSPDEHAADLIVTRTAEPFARHLDLLGSGGWPKGSETRPQRLPVTRWLPGTPLQFRAGAVPTRPSAALPAGVRRVKRTFLPIPLVRWQRYSSLVTPHDYVSINSSIVIGRRNVWPTGGGRTFGIAVQVRVWLDRPAPPAPAARVASVQDRLVSAIRAVVDRSGGQGGL